MASNLTRRPLVDASIGRPALIAHKAGNTAEQALAAIGHVADYLEVDLYVTHGRFEARHEHRFSSRLPILWDKWRLAMLPRERFGLAELLKKAEGRSGIFLDLKSGGRQAAELVRRAVDESEYHQRLVASSQLWSVLRALNDVCPEVDLYYSITARSQLDLFLSVLHRDTRPRGVSIQHKLLDERTVAQIHDRGMLVVAWTVDDPERAAELTAMGVDGITTHRVMELRERLEP